MFSGMPCCSAITWRTRPPLLSSTGPYRKIFNDRPRRNALVCKMSRTAAKCISESLMIVRSASLSVIVVLLSFRS